MKVTTQHIIDNLIERYPELDDCKEDLVYAVELLIHCYRNHHKVLVCGNGGSAADAQHIVGELMKGFALPRTLPSEKQEVIQRMFPETSQYLIDNLQATLPAISLLGETALISAYSNDKAPDLVFAQQVLGHGETGDVLFAISTSGTSRNVVYACQMARVQGMQIIGLTGASGGTMKEMCEVAICAPSDNTYQIQEYHLPIYHAICLALEEEFFGEEC